MKRGVAMFSERALINPLIPVILLLGAGCQPPLDENLSPPIVLEPIYTCASDIAFSGAARDPIIAVYVNGSKVKQQKHWLGWGPIRLDAPLTEGDVVAVAQIVGGRESWKTRDKVTVEKLPPNVLQQEKLDPPSVAPPLYACQQIVKVEEVLPGASVTLRNLDAVTWRGRTPYDFVYLRVPPLKSEMPEPEERMWFNSFQKICEDGYSSDWSKKEFVQATPSSLADPVVREPVPKGSDAVIVDGLVRGAAVEIYAEDGSGESLVASNIAAEASQIFRISPPVDKNFDYRPDQALCEVKAKGKSITPSEEVPAPWVKGPLCAGEYYVTVCDTTAMSDVEVFADGNRVTGGAGNGNCITVALGNAKVFGNGQQVTATQSVAGVPSSASASVPVKLDGAPSYDPTYWNHPKHIIRNNCYNYGTDIRTGTFAQPGKAHKQGIQSISCAEVIKAALADGLIPAVDRQCSGCTHKVALVVDDQGPSLKRDFHWYRLDDTKAWSHKLASFPATDRDASGNPIGNPESADRDHKGPDYGHNYSKFCGYFCVDKDFVKIE
jgi:hypothetical protein